MHWHYVNTHASLGLSLLVDAYQLARNRKDFSKHFDPCQEAANKSIKCLHRNPGQKDLCNDYFQLVVIEAQGMPGSRDAVRLMFTRAYRDCKKAWVGYSINHALPMIPYSNILCGP